MFRAENDTKPEEQLIDEKKEEEEDILLMDEEEEEDDDDEQMAEPENIHIELGDEGPIDYDTQNNLIL